MATEHIAVGRSPVRLDSSLSTGDRVVLQNQSEDPIRYAVATGTAAPTAASATVYLGSPTVATHSVFSHANLRGIGASAPANPTAGEMWFDNAHLLQVGAHRFAGRWQRAFSRNNPLSGLPETVWSDHATLAQLRTAFGINGLRWIAPELDGSVLVFSNSAALSPLGGEFASDAALFAWLDAAGTAYDPTAVHLYYNATRARIMRLTGAYSDQRSSGPSLTVQFNPAGTASEDLHARGAQGNGWTLRRGPTGAAARAEVDAINQVIEVDGVATAGDLATALTGLPSVTLITAYAGGATATSPLGNVADDYAFSGGSDAGPAARSSYLVLGPDGGLVPMEIGATSVWGWLAENSNGPVGRVARSEA